MFESRNKPCKILLGCNTTLVNMKNIGPGCYLIKGKVTEEFRHISLEVSDLKRYDNKVLR